jgi:hypothetical protein
VVKAKIAAMPLDSVEAYERLGQHLTAIDPIMEAFCRENGFTRRTIGVPRYPTRRLYLDREVRWCIELYMEEDERGQRYDHFFPDIPYTLGGIASLDRDGHRYYDLHRAFTRLPFQQVPERLAVGLREMWERIRHFTPDYLIALGHKKISDSKK